MPKYYEGQFLKFIGNALKENAVILTFCMSAFSSHPCLIVNLLGMPLKFHGEN